MPSSDAELFLALRRALDELGMRWYLFGAQAALLHGAERFTADVDVTVEIGEIPSTRLSSSRRAWFRSSMSRAACPWMSCSLARASSEVVPFAHAYSVPPQETGGTTLEDRRGEYRAMRDGISLDEAVARAEQQYRARVVRTEVQDEDGRKVYVLKLLSEDGRVITVRIDAATGRMR